MDTVPKGTRKATKRKVQPQTEDEGPRTYYEALWKERLNWTGHFIPIRIQRWDLYLEAYIISPPVPGQNLSRQHVPVKLAVLPSETNDTIHVPLSEIYPSARRLHRASQEAGGIVETKVATVTAEFQPPPKKVSEATLKKLEYHLPGYKWTLFELMAMFGRPWNMAAVMLGKCKDISLSGDKYCMITGEKQAAYRIGQVVTIKEGPIFSPTETVHQLEAEYEGCTLCKLGTLRKARGANLVFGRGASVAEGMIIAESPWEVEERDKKPLHPEAPAGGVLYRVMKKVGLSQDEWYLTNSVICRPLLDPKAPISKNKPKTEHLHACNARLKRTVRAVSPKIVVLLGIHAYQAWFGHPPEGGVGKNIGWVTTRNKDTRNAVNYFVFFTYHPSYIARKEGTTGSRDAQRLYLEHWTTIAQAFKEMNK